MHLGPQLKGALAQKGLDRIKPGGNNGGRCSTDALSPSSRGAGGVMAGLVASLACEAAGDAGGLARD